MNIVGLGKAGCAIADRFSEYPQYEIYKIDVGLEGKRCYDVKERSSPEEYEANTPSFKRFFGKIGGETLFIIGGSGSVSAMSLRIVEQIKGTCEISILYIKPDTFLLSEPKKLHEKVTYNVLQEYARSAAVKRIYLVSNPELENILGDVPIVGYYEKLNDLIVSTMHMTNVFLNSDTILGGLSLSLIHI